MRIRNLKPYYLKHLETVRDEKEGGRREAFSPAAIRIEANIYDESQNLQPALTGIRPEAGKIMLFDPEGLVCGRDDASGQERYYFRASGMQEYIAAGDGICVYAPPEEEPDYRIKSIVLRGHLECGLERVYGGNRGIAGQP